MTKIELQFVRALLARVTPQDAQVAKAVAYVEKDLAQYAARQGQLSKQYEHGYEGW